MAKDSDKSVSDDGSSGLDRVREEIVRYLGARAHDVTKKAGQKVSGLAGQLTGAVGDGSVVAGAKRALGGESPVKAIVSEKVKKAGGEVVGKAKETLTGGGSNDQSDVKVTNIVEAIDVGVPLRTVYDHWTQFEAFSDFTKGVKNVSQSDEATSDWNLKVGPSTRSWEATIQEQVPDERIVWTSEGEKGTTRGSVTFHELAPNLTRIVAVIEYTPAGFVEKTANLWRAGGRRLRLDLKHFARHVTLEPDEEIEGWRGEIRDGEVVRSHEEGLRDDEENDQDEDEEEEEDEYEDEEDEEDEEERGRGGRGGVSRRARRRRAADRHRDRGDHRWRWDTAAAPIREMARNRYRARRTRGRYSTRESSRTKTERRPRR